MVNGLGSTGSGFSEYAGLSGGGQKITDTIAIAQTKAVTAVDGFVYDTSKDSDRNAWRDRCSHLSWYREDLNTATRGATRKHPAVAVTIAEASTLTIHDGDDPALPMWKVEDFTGFTITSVAALNGIIAVGTTTGLVVLNYLADSVDVSLTYSTTTTPAIVNDTINDVSMTVLPGAPIDPATGLQVPTIAVATAGGTSVITDGGDVYDSLATPAHDYLSFASSGLWFGRDTGINFATYEDIAAGDGFGDNRLSTTWATTRALTPTRIRNDMVGVGDALAYAGDIAPVGLGRTIFDYGTFGNSMSALITSTYNTGYMHGDNKGAFLSSVDATDLVGTELVTNGDFPTDTSGWTASSATLSVVSGAMRVTNTTTGFGLAYQSFTTVIGETYVATLDFTAGTANGKFGIGTTATGEELGATAVDASSPKTITFVATTTTTWIDLVVPNVGIGFYADFDNISVRLADEDRSVNANGLAVHGTVTKTAVATGADLVAYSGFSASNYLEQPYNADLDFGTGDFSVMGWVNTSGGGFQTVLDTRDAATTEGFVIYKNGSSLTFRTTAASANSDVTAAALVDSIWQFISVVRSASGTLQAIYLDGAFVQSGSVTARNLTGTNAPCRIGVDGSALSALAGSLALLRISATAPTTEQIKATYEAEKGLFTEDAKAVLPADAVTALGFDDQTRTLKIGTASGMAEMQEGSLVVADQDAVAVSTFISSADELEAKQ